MENMEQFFTQVNLRKHTNTLLVRPATHDVTPATFAQVGQVRILLDALSRHVEDVQRRHAAILSNPNQEEGESGPGSQNRAGANESIC